MIVEKSLMVHAPQSKPFAEEEERKNARDAGTPERGEEMRGESSVHDDEDESDMDKRGRESNARRGEERGFMMNRVFST